MSTSIRTVPESEDLPGRATLLLARISRRYQREYESAAADLGLTVLQAKALLTVVGEPLPMRELARRIYSEPPNLTGVVDGLQTLGLVQRRPDPQDRRVKVITATAAGVGVAEGLADRLPFVMGVLDALTVDQQSTLVALLELVAVT